MMQVSQGSMGAPWHQTYHSSASTTDLSTYETGFLRKSPDQYSSRGSMESLDHGHPAYSSCHQLSPSKSSGSIDHLHSKRDSAYSSFSTSSSIPEYPAAAGLPLGKERSYSMESMLSPQQRGPEGLRQADIRYVRTVYDPQQGISEEHEVNPVALLHGGEGRAHGEAVRGHRNSSSSSSGSSGGGGSTASVPSRHSLGPAWGSKPQHNSYESLKGAPAPPLRSDSYAAIRNHERSHERPSSWSSLEQARSMRALQKGSWHHSSGSVSSGKSLFAAEGQHLHTLVEKSPESSPTTRPRQGIPQAPPSGRVMLPTGIYQVPPPKPHFAQAPSCCPSSNSVYPALAKESRGTSHGDWGMGVSVDGPAVENGYQSSTSSTAGQPPCFPQPKLQAHQKDRRREEEAQPGCGLYRPHFKPGAEAHGAPQTHSQEHTYRRDPYTPVQTNRERQRHLQGAENEERCRQTREEEQLRPAERIHHADATHQQNDFALPEGRPGFDGSRDVSIQSSQGSGRGTSQSQRSNCVSNFFDPGTLQQDHPLTRLENALAEVQRAASPESTLSQCSSRGGRGEEAPPARVSVLEKVTRFERHHEQGKPRSQSSSHADYPRHGSVQSGPTSVAKSSFPGEGGRRGQEMPKVSAHFRSQSYSAVDPVEYREQQQYFSDVESLQRGQGREKLTPRNLWDKDMALQRSKSTFQLGEENGKDFHWRDNLQDILGTFQDTSFNSAYRDSIKGAQDKVLRSTSFRRKDLSIDSPALGKHMSLERKAPKTLPKPAVVFPHAPKERHIVTPDVGTTCPPELPRVPPVGPPVARIGGRKRLTLEQKKRSYSEPEKMHEVGVSDAESSASSQGKGAEQLSFPETSVADKRRLFELAAHRSAGPRPGPAAAASRPDLKQLQQDALAEYMERKTGRRAARSQRPQSAYLQPSPFSSDSQSLSSTSSLASLQELELAGPPRSGGHPGVGRISSTLPPGLQGCFYSDRNHTRPPSSSGSTSSASSAHRPRERSQGGVSSERELDKTSPLAPTQRLPQTRDGAFERAGPARNSGKSASAEDLLDRSEERAVPQHFRSRSSPSAEKLNQDVMAGGHRQHGIFSKEPLPSRPVENMVQEGYAVPLQRAERYLPNSGPSQQNTPVTRREKQRNVDRQRAHSASDLAASVGLPSPFSSPPPSGMYPDWQANSMLCQASLDALTRSLFPSPAPARGPGPKSQRGVTRQGSADSSASEETLKDFPGAGPGPQIRPEQGAAGASPPREEEERSLASAGPDGHPSQTESPALTPTRPLPSLRISESSLHSPLSPHVSQDDDEVFLQEPALPSPPPPPLPVWETDTAEDFPLPPPPPPQLPSFTEEEQEFMEMPQPPPPPEQLNSTDSLDDTAANRGTTQTLSDLSPPPVTSDPTPAPFTPSQSTEPQSPSGSSEAEGAQGVKACEAQESLELEFPLLTRRERSAEELRVEALAKELVSRDKSLSPILDPWAVKSTMDLMEDIFPFGAALQRRRSSRLEDSLRKNGDSVTKETQLQSQPGEMEMETDLDAEDVDLNQKKGELVRALTLSVAALREEKEGLAEEQRRFSALGGHMETLVQERCKPNEREKYRMFVGDLERIVNLLLSLRGRLARVETALAALEGADTEDSAEERESLQQKRRQLCSQHEDAWELKENLDRRERVVLDFLGGYLTGPQLRDYQHFVRVKPALLIRQRHLDELIRQGEEQLLRLGETLPPEYQEGGGTPISAPSPSPVSAPSPSPAARSTTVTSL
ncbi:protein Shroom3 isoform X2 [Megalops cyprinoides]|nr:protein Shroom3 isoform X2 [Megalops cyprinoides]